MTLGIAELFLAGAIAAGGWLVALWQSRLRRKAAVHVLETGHELQGTKDQLERRYAAYERFLRIIADVSIEFLSGTAREEARETALSSDMSTEEMARALVNLYSELSGVAYRVIMEISPLVLVSSPQVADAARALRESLSKCVNVYESVMYTTLAGGAPTEEHLTALIEAPTIVSPVMKELRKQMRDEMDVK